MIRVEVKNRISQELITRAILHSQEQIDSWLIDCKKYNCFGKNERWVTEDMEDISSAIETREIETPLGLKTEYRLLAEYTIEQVDISTQVEQERINQEALEYLKSTDWYIIREMDEGTPCPADIKSERILARNRIVR